MIFPKRQIQCHILGKDKERLCYVYRKTKIYINIMLRMEKIVNIHKDNYSDI